MNILINSSVNQEIVKDWAMRLLENANEQQCEAIVKNIYQLGMIEFSNEVKNHFAEIDKIEVKSNRRVSSEMKTVQQKRLSQAHKLDSEVTHAWI